MAEFESLEVVVEHLPPAKCTFGEFATSWVVGRPREYSVSRIAVVIHLASLIALVLEFEPYGEVHGSHMQQGLGHVVDAINTEERGG